MDSIFDSPQMVCTYGQTERCAQPYVAVGLHRPFDVSLLVREHPAVRLIVPNAVGRRFFAFRANDRQATLCGLHFGLLERDLARVKTEILEAGLAAQILGWTPLTPRRITPEFAPCLRGERVRLAPFLKCECGCKRESECECERPALELEAEVDTRRPTAQPASRRVFSPDGAIVADIWLTEWNSLPVVALSRASGETLGTFVLGDREHTPWLDKCCFLSDVQPNAAGEDAFASDPQPNAAGEDVDLSRSDPQPNAAREDVDLSRSEPDVRRALFAVEIDPWHLWAVVSPASPDVQKVQAQALFTGGALVHDELCALEFGPGGEVSLRPTRVAPPGFVGIVRGGGGFAAFLSLHPATDHGTNAAWRGPAVARVAVLRVDPMPGGRNEAVFEFPLPMCEAPGAEEVIYSSAFPEPKATIAVEPSPEPADDGPVLSLTYFDGECWRSARFRALTGEPVARG